MRYKVIQIERVSGSLGAEVRGIDLNSDIDAQGLAEIRHALQQYLVLFFRDQDLTPERHKIFGRRFGTLQTHPVFPTVEGHPEIVRLEVDQERPPQVEEWHCDVTYDVTPPMGSMLHAQVIPEVGGDTLWANQYAAYEALSDRMQRLIDGMTATHSFTYGFRHTLAQPGATERYAKDIKQFPPVAHPVVRTHPETGRKGLFVNGLFTIGIVGMKESESNALLRFLTTHCVEPEFTCRFRWTRHALAFWDNRVTQHRPVNDFWPQTRYMRRVVIEGERPV